MHLRFLRWFYQPPVWQWSLFLPYNLCQFRQKKEQGYELIAVELRICLSQIKSRELHLRRECQDWSPNMLCHGIETFETPHSGISGKLSLYLYSVHNRHISGTSLRLSLTIGPGWPRISSSTIERPLILTFLTWNINLLPWRSPTARCFTRPPKDTVIARIENQPYINDTMDDPVKTPRKQTKRLRQAKQKSVTFTG